MGTLWYFLGIEVAQFKEGISLSQRKYVLDILEETGLLGSKPVETPMLMSNCMKIKGSCYLILRDIGKLNYLTITRLDILFAVSVVS